MIPDDPEVRDQSPSETPDLSGDLGGGTGIPLSGFVRLITMVGQILNNTKASNRWSLQIPDFSIETPEYLGIVLVTRSPEYPYLGLLDR